MPRAIPLPVRQALLHGHQRGVAAAALARQFRLPLRTVYHLLRQARLRQGQVTAPAYHAPAPAPGRRSPSSVRPGHSANSTPNGAPS
jgi:hypothetical protein